MLRFDEKLPSTSHASGKEISLGSDDEYHEDSVFETAELSGFCDEIEDIIEQDRPVKVDKRHVRPHRLEESHEKKTLQQAVCLCCCCAKTYVFELCMG